MRTCIFIDCGGGEFFENGANLLVDFYNETIREHNLDMCVYTYQSIDGVKFIADEENHKIYVPCGQTEWSKKLFSVFSYIQKSVDCEYVVKTNTSTVLNLVQLDDFTKSEMVTSSPKWWYPYNMVIIETNMPVVVGCFWCFHKSMITDVFNNLGCFYGAERIDSVDDLVISYGANELGMPVQFIPENKFVDVWGTFFDNMSNFEESDEIRNAMVYVIRMRIDIDVYSLEYERYVRGKFEPPTMKFLFRLIREFNRH